MAFEANRTKRRKDALKLKLIQLEMSFTIKEKIQMELFNIKKETMTVSLSYRVYHAQDFSDPGFQ